MKKIIIYSRTDKGLRALKKEYGQMTEAQRLELEKVFSISYDEKIGIVALTGKSKALDFLPDYSFRATIETALTKEGCQANIDYKVVVENV